MTGRGEIALELFVQGQSPHSNAAVELVRRVCETYRPSGYRLEVIDIHQQPERTGAAGILAAPALIRRSPPPVLRIVGRLTEERLVERLGLAHV